MSALTLTLTEAPAQRLDMAGLTPDTLAGRGAAEIECLPLALGNHALPLAELFRVEPGDGLHLVLQGSTARLDGIGRGMAQGRLTVEGDAGAYLGAGLRGGRIEVRGSAGAFAAAAMRAGTIRIDGSVGDFLAGAPIGERFGMRGGTVIVEGSADDRAGDRMRRGVVVIGGNAGDYCASRMVAGTIVIGRGCGDYPGFSMRRGTLLLASEPARLLPTFADGGRHEMLFLRLLLRHLREVAPDVALPLDAGRVHRLTGDLAAAGKGEILVADGPG